MNSDDGEKEVSSQSWNKLTRSLHQVGYREGVSAGRDLTFQKGFDTGYLQGFEVGYKLGLHNGVLRYLKSGKTCLDATIKEQLSTVEPIEQPNRGLCVVCLEEEKNKQNIDNTADEKETTVKQIAEIRELQNDIVLKRKKLLLTENYSSVLKSTKLDKLLI